MMYFSITDDFDLKKIADSGQCFRWEQIEEEYYRILHSDRCVYGPWRCSVRCAVRESWIITGKRIMRFQHQTLESLRSLYGVWPKVANCVSLFGLHHVNAFPEDVWIKRVLKQEYPEGYPFDDYSPYNGVYQQYMFAYYREGES